ncbi:late embryogenesis abundant protein [Medicago truncatula]|uniref:Late embryogenesis abundant protein n=1 Tax=Medicago truncatula TaxID=3880 RepID=G7II42_MEDTR|nr:late embryogenesis abundant protein [Medicago truncatula]
MYIFYPSDPYLKIVRLKLKKIKVHRVPHITVDISMLFTLRVQNVDVYSMDFGAVDVAVSYRGKPLGHVTSKNGHVRAMGSSFVDADAEFSGIGVLPEIVLLLEDLAKGMVPFDTVSQVRGKMGILFFYFPIKAKLSCAVLVSTINQTIIRQHCLYEGQPPPLAWQVQPLLEHHVFPANFAKNLGFQDFRIRKKGTSAGRK